MTNQYVYVVLVVKRAVNNEGATLREETTVLGVCDSEDAAIWLQYHDAVAGWISADPMPEDRRTAVAAHAAQCACGTYSMFYRVECHPIYGAAELADPEV